MATSVPMKKQKKIPDDNAKSQHVLTLINRKKYLEYAVVIVFFLLILVVFFRKFLVLSPGNMLFGMDTHSFLYFFVEFIVTSLKKDHILPFWNPYALSGIPTLVLPVVGSVFYPLSFPVFLFDLSFAFVLLFIIHLALAGASMYWFSRKFIGRVPSLVSSIVLVFSGYMIGAVYMGHPEGIAVMAWLPLFFGSIHELSKSLNKKHLILAVLAFTMQILTGTHIFVLFMLEMVFLWVCVVLLPGWIFQKRWKEMARFILAVGLILLISFGLAGIQLIPFMEFITQSIRSNGLSFDIASGASWNWIHFSYLFKPIGADESIILNPATGEMIPKALNLEYLYYVGKIPILLFFISLITEGITVIKSKKINAMFLFALLGIVIFFALAFGRNFPLYQLFYTVNPVYQLVRRPVRHLMIVTFLVAFISGYAVYKIRWNVVQVCILILVTFELFHFGSSYLRIYPEPQILNNKELIRILKERVALDRIYLNYRISEISQLVLYDNAGSYYRLPLINGYTPMILGSYDYFTSLLTVGLEEGRLTKIQRIALDSQVLDFLGGRFVLDQNIRREAKDDPNIPPYFLEVFKTPAATLYENPRALSRFFLASRIVSSQNDATMGQLIRLGKIDLSNSVMIEKKDIEKIRKSPLVQDRGTCEEGGELGTVEVTKYEPNRIALSTVARCQVMLVSSEPFYPGWEATIDGRSTTIYRSNIAFRSILLPKGNHRVDFFYNPRIYYIGLVLTLISAAISVLFLWKAKIEYKE